MSLIRQILLVFIAVASAAQMLEPPLLGIILDRSNHFRHVYGIAGNFVLGPPGSSTEKPVSTATLAMGGTVLTARHGTLSITLADGLKRRVTVDGGIQSFRQMGEGWVQVNAHDAQYALRLSDFRLYRLPQ